MGLVHLQNKNIIAYLHGFVNHNFTRIFEVLRSGEIAKKCFFLEKGVIYYIKYTGC